MCLNISLTEADFKIDVSLHIKTSARCAFVYQRPEESLAEKRSVGNSGAWEKIDQMVMQAFVGAARILRDQPLDILTIITADLLT